jgi:iron only hydrogenase large subunit-like protein/uncharacterized Fe-S cluster-containing protein
MGLIYRSEANCKNCYRCVRVCPVKAVKFAGGQAEVMEDFCLHCGECVLACPQKAKSFSLEDKEMVRSWLGRERIIVSLAPSAAAFFPDLPALIKRLVDAGVEEVRETAEGASLVADAYREWVREHPGQPWISANCPVVVELFEKHHPDLLPYLAPIVSPMVAHGRLIKDSYGLGVKVVMVSPCPAKIGESRDPRTMKAIDAVVTFEEINELLVEESEQNNKVLDMKSDFPEANRISRLFPLPGGMLPASGEALNWKHDIYHGPDDLASMIEALHRGELGSGIVEALGCRQGCLGGFVFRRNGHSAVRNQRFLSLLSTWPTADWKDGPIELKRTYKNRQPQRKLIPEFQIRQVLKEIGKSRPEDELNCGACGYSSCREKAIAVCYGQAEVGMCMPYMGTRAESLSNKIIEATPNAIILVDSKLLIREFNPSAEMLFQRNRGEALGQPLDSVFPADDFRQVVKDRRPIIGKKVAYPKYGRYTRQTIVWVEEQEWVLALITDITREEHQSIEMQKVKEETIEKAQEVIDKQMRTVQEIAGLLGETAAESKILLTQLMGLVSREGGEGL